MKNLFKIALLTAIVTTSAGCQKRDSANAVRLPTVIIEADGSGDALTLEALGAEDLFARAKRSLMKGDCKEAVKDYSQIIEVYPDSKLVELSLYNQGLCHTQLENHESAAAAFSTIIEKYPDSKNVKDSLFMLGGSYEKLKKWDSALTVFDKMLDDSIPTDSVDKIEVLARKGNALIHLEQPSLAKESFEKAILIFKKDEVENPTSPDYYFSMAQFELAGLVHNEMRSITLPSDESILLDALEKKCRLLLNSQHLYTRVIRTGHPHWSGAAAYKTGALYHHLWVDMLNAPPPEGLTEEEHGIYMEILHKRTKNLLKKAIKQWKRTIKFAMRLNLDNKWISETKENLAKIEVVLQAEEQIATDLDID